MEPTLEQLIAAACTGSSSNHAWVRALADLAVTDPAQAIRSFAYGVANDAGVDLENVYTADRLAVLLIRAGATQIDWPELRVALLPVHATGGTCAVCAVCAVCGLAAGTMGPSYAGDAHQACLEMARVGGAISD